VYTVRAERRYGFHGATLYRIVPFVRHRSAAKRNSIIMLIYSMNYTRIFLVTLRNERLACCGASIAIHDMHRRIRHQVPPREGRENFRDVEERGCSDGDE